MTDPHKAALSERIASDSLILLKNDGTLLLKKGLKLAAIGPHADNLRYPISGYTYPAYIEMMSAGAHGDGSVSFNGIADEAAAAKTAEQNPFAAMLAMFSEEDRARLTDLPTLLASLGCRSLKDVLSDRFDVTHAQGCPIMERDTSGVPEAVRAAQENDVVILALGGNCGWVNVTGGEGKDRFSLEPPGVQEQLWEAVCAAGKPVADVLDGTKNPRGHLTFTIPRHVGQLPLYYDLNCQVKCNTDSKNTS